MKNLEQALQQAAARLDAAIKRELDARGHNKTGKLKNSIKTDVVRGPGNGYTLNTQMEEYGRKLNERSPFLDASISSEEEAINRMIEDAVHEDLNDFLDQEM
ncbi:hypothetical protein BH09BAC1_BH09BAC1_24370 [soil metagenome]